MTGVLRKEFKSIVRNGLTIAEITVKFHFEAHLVYHNDYLDPDTGVELL